MCSVIPPAKALGAYSLKPNLLVSLCLSWGVIGHSYIYCLILADQLCEVFPIVDEHTVGLNDMNSVRRGISGGVWRVHNMHQYPVQHR